MTELLRENGEVPERLPIPTAGVPAGLPPVLADLLLLGKATLCERRRQDERDRREKERAAEQCRREHWAALVSFAAKDLGEDLAGFVTWILPNTWTAETRRHILTIRIRGLAPIEVQYAHGRAAGEAACHQWCRLNWYAPDGGAQPWRVVGGATVTREEVAPGVADSPSFHQDLGEALAVAQMVHDGRLVQAVKTP